MPATGRRTSLMTSLHTTTSAAATHRQHSGDASSQSFGSVAFQKEAAEEQIDRIYSKYEFRYDTIT